MRNTQPEAPRKSTNQQSSTYASVAAGGSQPKDIMNDRPWYETIEMLCTAVMKNEETTQDVKTIISYIPKLLSPPEGTSRSQLCAEAILIL
jgi:hypothetical protein